MIPACDVSAAGGPGSSTVTSVRCQSPLAQRAQPGWGGCCG
jgi:hypothetical protein